MKKFIIFALVAGVSIVCYGKKKYAITMSGESLTTLTQVTDNEEPCLDPFGGDNGTALFFSVRENKKFYNIYKKDNPFSAAMSQKTSGKNFNRHPCFNAATDKISFSCKQDGAGSSDIFTMFDNKGKALSQITESADAFEQHPSFSPDGTLIIYSKVQHSYYKRTGGLGALLWGSETIIVENSELWLRNLKTGENILLGNGYQPCFSHDGTKIAYVKYSSDAKSTSIWVMNIDGSEQMQITDAKKGYAMNPRWSPDDTQLVFGSMKKDKKDSDLYIIDIDGNNLTQLTINKSYDGQPYWTTDGYIYFVSDRGNNDGNYQIWRFKH